MSDDFSFIVNKLDAMFEVGTKVSSRVQALPDGAFFGLNKAEHEVGS
jgi:hypothetical protein